MGFQTRYVARVLEDGKVIEKRRFIVKDKLLNFVKNKARRGRRISIDTKRVFQLVTFQNTAWGPAPHDPWTPGPKPISEIFIHHSVTAQLPASATVDQEAEQMRLLDQIAHGRGFNGISYCWAIMPSSRAWEGRGFGIVEAGTEGHNTSGDSIVLVGNYSAFDMSAEQMQAIIALIRRGQRDGFFVKTNLDVRAHREVSATSCPGDKVTAADIAVIQKAVN